MGTIVPTKIVTSTGSKTGGDKLLASFPSVCFTPANPQPFAPAPFPNAGAGGPTAAKAPVAGVGPIGVKNAAFASSTGDETGAGRGLASMAQRGKAYFVMAGSNVVYEGSAVTKLLGVPQTNNAAADTTAAIAMAKSKMTALHSQLLGQSSTNAAAWHGVLEEYIKAVSSLYILLNLK